MVRAPVNRILPLSLVDGPGARCAVFLQGCSLSCAYCHNPETQSLCSGCGACVEKCPAGALSLAGGRVRWSADRCVGCDRCIALCPNRASPKVRERTAEAVFREVERSAPLIRGLTVSGGECSLYPEFLTRLFRLARAAGLGCLMDSNGMEPFWLHPELMEACDGVMLDVKAWDPARHAALTGQSNETVRENLAYLSRTGKLEEVRVVCLEPEVDVPEVLAGAARVLGVRRGETRLKLIRFRRFGVRGPLALRPSPDDGEMERYRALALRLGWGEVRVL